MRIVPVHGGSTTTLGFVPALVSLCVASWMCSVFTLERGLGVRLDWTLVFANLFANAWLIGIAAASYTIWVFALARRWVTAATGGGFVVAAHGLILRAVVEVPQIMAQTPLAHSAPPEPYGTVLILGRTLGIVAFVMGLGFVVAAVVSERRLRRAAPDWAITE